jgi:hypothetical protein
MEFKFTLEDLDGMYDEAMSWEPPVTPQNPLQNVLAAAQKPPEKMNV